MKKILSFVLIMVLVATMLPVASFAAPKDKGDKIPPGHQNANKNKEENEQSMTEIKERLMLMVQFGEGTWEELPYGLSKRDALPPGLRKFYESNRLPYGLAKRFSGWIKPHPDLVQDLTALSNMIKRADSLLANAGTGKYVQAAIDALVLATANAKTFVAQYTEAKKAELPAELEKLRVAILAFENAEIYGAPYIEKLNKLSIELTAYKVKFFPGDAAQYSSNTHYQALVTLLAKIQTFIRTENPLVLTKGAYIAILEEAKAFKDHLTVLRNLIALSKDILYVNKDANPLTYKYTEGVLAGQVIQGSNDALKASIAVAETFANTYTEFNYTVIGAEVQKLELALATFKGNLVLGAEEKDILADTLQLLGYVTSTPELETLKSELLLYSTSGILTKAKFAELLDASKPYIKGLYDAIVLQLTTAIAQGETLLASGKVVPVEIITALSTAVDAAKAYLLKPVAEYRYLELNEKYQALSNAITAFINVE